MLQKTARIMMLKLKERQRNPNSPCFQKFAIDLTFYVYFSIKLESYKLKSSQLTGDSRDSSHAVKASFFFSFRMGIKRSDILGVLDLKDKKYTLLTGRLSTDFQKKKHAVRSVLFQNHVRLPICLNFNYNAQVTDECLQHNY